MSPASITPLPIRRRAVFVSDVHLGARHCHAAELADFLGNLRCDRLYLVGDIVDLWWMSQRRASWGAAQYRVVEALHALARAGTELIYVPGNHDRSVRRFCGLALPRMQVRRRAIHLTADGRRLLVTHGDDYDSVTQFGGMQEKFGDWLYERILTGNQLTNRVRRRFGLRYWSLADFLKRRSGAAERYISRFVQAGLNDARQRGLDGIVCGHIHRAALFERDGCIYANDGDWVESLTALAEDPDGTLRLLAHTGETLAMLPARAARLAVREELPHAA
ncbi:UDP-2,3-diacylglucosamine diphosphatase [Lysobacter capsici]|jgi:UDP-2,3-diacylglucosamine pyrophosphatase LpxH|uniref:UDP-2,3-diacylglucosamine hydrolase n=1 Tax=Lysobacter capsici AZ78 TaxID=1444315 RepID=A0A108U8A6_9GAMM|nr:UDP-2,3-diacylglucosamine diphosphatase [Lysobacter capsici]KWS04364.1 UDP-2,3-diacylglucosamine hydrolase [Lysobacter capsici AZ78]UOF16035.1 UDP-2,3-diacylglucosamine diphosphatase [Lysobacter capsici]WND81764.1 UDP-2,3-diacylglucosamine diphosphatase [Lysobacter capsici]WND86960.1 UDP-2,3-diacylglucosamine diphosphatase [Lysobacter capsici]